MESESYPRPDRAGRAVRLDSVPLYLACLRRLFPVVRPFFTRTRTAPTIRAWI